MHLTTVAVLRDGVRSAVRVDGPEKRKMFLDGCEYFMGTTGGGDVSDCFDFDGRGTCFRTKNAGITGEDSC